MTEPAQRRLAAIVSTDVVGYSRLMGQDERGTLETLRSHRAELIDDAIATYGGRIVKTTGDGLLAEFPSVVAAVDCCVAVQDAMVRRNADVAADRAVRFRIGIHLGDIIVDGSDIFGEGVNIAARLQETGAPDGVAVSGIVHEYLDARQAAGFVDRGEYELKNIRRPIRVWQRVSENPAAGPAPSALAPQALPDKPSIAVLPFQNLSGDPEQEYFADGTVEDIITALSRLPWLKVIARNSSFIYKHREFDVKQVGRELGVRYVLEGSVRRAARRVRISSQLIEAGTGAHIWADRFDGDLENVFDLQDQIVTSAVAAIEPKLMNAEIDRARRKPTENLDAYDHYLRGLACFDSNTREGIEQALHHFLAAVGLDANYAAAYGMAAYCRHRRRVWGLVADRAKEAQETELLARRAVLLGKDDSIALATAGFALAHTPHNQEAGAALIDRACAMNPGSAMGWWMNAVVRSWLADAETSIQHAERAKSLNPLGPHLHQIQLAIGNAQFVRGRYAEAAELALQALHVEPDYVPALRLAAASCGLLGRAEEASAAATQLRRRFPDLTLAAYKDLLPFCRPADLDAYLDGLRRAGVPE